MSDFSRHSVLFLCSQSFYFFRWYYTHFLIPFHKGHHPNPSPSSRNLVTVLLLLREKFVPHSLCHQSAVGISTRRFSGVLCLHIRSNCVLGLKLLGRLSNWKLPHFPYSDNYNSCSSVLLNSSGRHFRSTILFTQQKIKLLTLRSIN